MADGELRLAPPPGDPAALVLSIVAELVRELRVDAGPPARIELDSDLERDLGLDSLERAELLQRLETISGLQLPPHTLAAADTPRDLVRALGAGRSVAPAIPVHPAAPPPVAAAIPESAQTLPAVLAWHAAAQPTRTHLTLLCETDAGPREEPLTFGALAAEAGCVAANLAGRGVSAGERVAIMLPTSREFFVAFFGVLLAGAVPVPIYPPARRSQLEEHVRRQAGILANCDASTLITVPEARAVAWLLRASVSSLARTIAVGELMAPGAAPVDHVASAHDIAFLQYTSGSTGEPKGVILSHANVLANIRAMGRAIAVQPNDVFLSWLPLYHDMGLIGAWLGSLYFGIPLIVMPPTDFLARPERWLRAITRYRATLSAGPNFAYEICAARIPAERLAGLDLSSLRIAFNGAEPVVADTITRFAQRFAPYGFDAAVQLPVYGLAEAAVGLTFPPLGRGPLVDHVDRETLRRSGVAMPRAEGDPRARAIVSCGRPLPDYAVRVIDSSARERAEREEGRVEFRGPSATSGYFHNREATRRLFDGDWLDTGDTGYIADGELYLTGRVKDVIIRAGQHIHPQDAEAALGAIAGIRKGCVTVFGVPDHRGGTEKVVVLAETRERDPQRRRALQAMIAERTTSLLGAPADDIVLAPPHTVLKTSSGKIRRAACSALYQRGMRGAAASAVWLQVVRLASSGAGRTVSHALAKVGEFAYGAYTWFMALMLGALALLAVIALPQGQSRRRAVNSLARLFVRAAAVPVRIVGAEHLAGPGPLMVVANHASYTDAIVLLTVLPESCHFVAKRELRRHWLLRVLLHGLDTRFVERFDIEQSVAAGHELVAAARQGESLVFFPEGTFTRESGLRSFHVGAFLAAAAAGVPVIPVALRGTRLVLRDGQWLPRRFPIAITVLPPLRPDGDDWAAALRLRDRSRKAMLAACGEPDLGMPRAGSIREDTLQDASRRSPVMH